MVAATAGTSVVLSPPAPKEACSVLSLVAPSAAATALGAAVTAAALVAPTSSLACSAAAVAAVPIFVVVGAALFCRGCASTASDQDSEVVAVAGRQGWLPAALLAPEDVGCTAARAAPDAVGSPRSAAAAPAAWLFGARPTFLSNDEPKFIACLDFDGAVRVTATADFADHGRPPIADSTARTPELELYCDVAWGLPPLEGAELTIFVKVCSRWVINVVFVKVQHFFVRSRRSLLKTCFTFPLVWARIPRLLASVHLEPTFGLAPGPDGTVPAVCTVPVFRGPLLFIRDNVLKASFLHAGIVKLFARLRTAKPAGARKAIAVRVFIAGIADVALLLALPPAISGGLVAVFVAVGAGVERDAGSVVRALERQRFLCRNLIVTRCEEKEKRTLNKTCKCICKTKLCKKK